MEEKAEYVVERIEGDYAFLRRTDKAIDDLNQVARALLPLEISEGTHLNKEWFTYTVIS
jgi:hypothetical protein